MITPISLSNKNGRLESKQIARGGLTILNLKNPEKPKLAGKFKQDGYTHDTHVPTYAGPDKAHQAKTIAFNANADSFSIVDVSDNQKQSAYRRTYTKAGYNHQGWTTDDQNYYLLNDSKDEKNLTGNNKARTHLWDIKDLDNPNYLGFHNSTEFSTDHNLYIKDDIVYQANYTSGLRVLKIKRDHQSKAQIKLTEIAFLDTTPRRITLKDIRVPGRRFVF